MMITLFHNIQNGSVRHKRIFFVCGVVISLLWGIIGIAYGMSGWLLNRLMQGNKIIEGTNTPSFYLQRLIETLLAAGVVGTLFIGVVGVLLVIRREHDFSMASIPYRAIFLGAFLFFMITGFVPRYLTGDEPHYILIAKSIVTDFDVELTDEYAEAPTLSPHYGMGSKGAYSVHNIGVGVLTALPWAIAGERGAILMMNVCAALLIVAFVRLLDACQIPHSSQFIAALGLTASLPTLTFASQIFPEIPGALCITMVFAELLQPTKSSRPNSWIVVIGISVLPWLSLRFFPHALVLVVCAFVFAYPNKRIGIIGLLTLIGTMGLLAWCHVFWFGNPWPQATHGNLIENLRGPALEGLLGLFLDQQYGLLWVAPTYLAWPLGLWLLLSSHRRIGLAIIALLICTVVPAVFSSVKWWGRWSSAGRYLTPVAPLLALAVIVLWERARTSRAVQRLMGWLLMLSLMIAMVHTILPDKQKGVFGDEGHNFYVSQVEKLLHRDLSAIIPRLAGHTTPAPMWGALAWLVIWMGLIVYIYASCCDTSSAASRSSAFFRRK